MSVQVHTSGQVTINGDAVLNVSSGDGGGPSTPVDLSGYVKKTELNIVANNLQSQINNLGGGGLNIVEGGEFINCSNPSEGVIVIASEPDPIINYTGLFSLELNQGNALIFDVFLGSLSFGSLPYKLSVMYEYKDLDFTETFLSCNEDQSGKYF
ncbi:hypothetical protein, partial [Acinetobacter sp. CFCC 10889]|uniref:hypothetical protein n=1 Tax=Acinetobacter sp. CFCC 10889 TaxID=1775557 RepID=UPI0013A6C666